MKRIIAFILLMIFMGFLLINIRNSSKFIPEKQTQLMMNTYVSITALGPDKETISSAIGSVFKRLKEIEIKFNHLNPESPLYAFNQESRPIQDTEILGLIRIALEVSRESGGAFDITVAPLLELWGFYKNSPYLPTKQEIQKCLQKVGYQHLLLKDGKLKKDNKNVNIDLGGIAKGYALAQAVRVLKDKGITSAVIDIGGDVYALGKKGPRLWKVGIRDPRKKGILGYVEVENLSVISSGDYERSFKKGGRRYHHIFNPKTGYPTEGVSSVTLIHPDPVLGQALSKAPFILGPQKGLELLEKIPGMQAIIITDSGQILHSQEFSCPIKGFKKFKPD